VEERSRARGPIERECGGWWSGGERGGVREP
jgi:hypothetical protein